ncbi:MAG: penicillin-binding protein 2 [Desulfobacterales bacterium]|nr:penicillin-binding protein 2 [Desulfobacterales bacterium]
MERFVKSVDHDWYKQRIVGMMLGVLAVFVVLLMRLMYLQVVAGDDYYRLSMNNSIRLQTVDPPRGLVLDRHGTKLAENRPSFDVSFTPKDAGDVGRVLSELAAYLNVPVDELQGKVKHSRGLAAFRPVVLKQDIGRDVLAAVEAHKVDMPGVSIQVRLRRNYLYELNASHLIGYLGEINLDELKSGDYPNLRGGDYIGKFGVERTQESVLRGEPGGRQVEVNANGQIMRVLQTVSPKPGRNVHLTLDRELQQRAEELLEGVAGAAVAVEPASGEILAMASSPSFNQNAFVSGIGTGVWEALISHPFRPLENKAIQGEYPPGSTFKIVTALAGLEEKAIDETTTFDCAGFLPFAGRDYRCWKKEGHGRVDVRRALSESCDVFFYRTGLRLGIDRLAWYAKAFGLGVRSGVTLDQEARGLIPSSAWKKKRFGVAWQEGETLSVSIGQGYVLATPLQMAMLTAAVGNGGIRYRPAVLSRVETMEGDVVFQTAPQEIGRLPISPRNLKIVQQGIWGAVNGERGTARRVHLNDTEIAGKTGTSQVVGRKDSGDDYTPPHHRPHAWFVCYAPFDAPKIAIAVVVENGEHGSSAAGPIAREMVKTYLRQLPNGQKLADDGTKGVVKGNG